MADLTEMLLQEFSDKVADICELMELDSEQMLQAIGSTLIGATLSFGKTDFQLEIPQVACVSVDTIFEVSS
jgi:hypothetical protein